MLYVLVLDELYREFSAAQLQAAVALGMGAEGAMPSWHDARTEFDAYLMSEPKAVDVAQQTHLVALGLR